MLHLEEPSWIEIEQSCFLSCDSQSPPGKQKQALDGFPIKSKQVNKREKLIFFFFSLSRTLVCFWTYTSLLDFNS